MAREWIGAIAAFSLMACSSANTESTPAATPQPNPQATIATGEAPAPTASQAPPAGSARAGEAPAPSASQGMILTFDRTAKAPVATTQAPVEEAPAGPVSTSLKGLLHSQLLGTEIVFVTVVDASVTCESFKNGKPSQGDRRVELRLPWETGYYDFSGRSSAAKFATYSSYWQKMDAQQGGIRVRSAPTRTGASGAIHLTAKNAKEATDVELTVLLCTDVQPKKPPKKP